MEDEYFMISAEKIQGSGFTIIVSDVGPLYDQPSQDQKKIDNMFNEIYEILKRHNFQIEMVGENEEMMRLQGRLLFNEFYKILDSSFVQVNSSD
jgi:hypothetical protein